MTSNKGIDSKGFILNPTGRHHIQSEYSPVLELVSSESKKQFSNLHSIYLYGSVGRGEAISFVSDLDLNLVFQGDWDPTHITKCLERIKLQALASVPFVSKIDLEPVHLQEVLAENQIYHWQAWFKHYCVCLWGTDLSPSFAPLKPSLKLAYNLNKGLLKRLENYRKDLTPDTLPQKSKEVGKLFIRIKYLLWAETDQSWYHRIDDCAQALLQYEPTQHPHVKEALFLISIPNHSIERFLSFLDQFEPIKEKFSNQT